MRGMKDIAEKNAKLALTCNINFFCNDCELDFVDLSSLSVSIKLWITMINVRKKKMESYLVDVYIAYKNQRSTAPKIIFGPRYALF